MARSSPAPSPATSPSHSTDANSVTASAQSGNVEVTVPKGDYQVEIQSEHGGVRNDVGDGSSGPTIDLRTESGDVTFLRRLGNTRRPLARWGNQEG